MSEEISPFKYSAHRDYTSEGIRLTVHVRGDDKEQTAKDMEEFYKLCVAEIEATGQKLAPFKEPKKSADQALTESVINTAKNQ